MRRHEKLAGQKGRSRAPKRTRKSGIAIAAASSPWILLRSIETEAASTHLLLSVAVSLKPKPKAKAKGQRQHSTLHKKCIYAVYLLKYCTICTMYVLCTVGHYLKYATNKKGLLHYWSSTSTSQPRFPSDKLQLLHIVIVQYHSFLPLFG
jgi:hypothetical protein